MVLSGGAAIALLNGPMGEIQEHLAVFFVSLTIGAVANIYARFTGSPAFILILNATCLIGACLRTGTGRPSICS